MPDKHANRAPWHLWVVGIIGTLWSAMGANDYLMTKFRVEAYMSRFTPEQLEFFYGFPAWVTFCWAIAVWGGVAGCLLLLFRKRVAYWVLLASFAGMLISMIRNYGFAGGAEIMGGAGPLIFSAVIFIISLGLVLYAQAMRKRGVLG